MNRHVLIFISLVLLCGADASARVFNLSDNKVAAYFRGTGGMHMMGQGGFSHSSGDSTYFENKDKPYYNYSGEIGLLIVMSEAVSLRLGIEGVQSRQISAPGYNAAGVHELDVDSKIAAFVPNLNLEFSFSRGVWARIYGFLGAGYATVKGTNAYTMTAAGTSLYGNTDYKEVVAGTAIMGQAGTGLEFSFVDNATFCLEGGWRYLLASKLTYQDTVTTVDGVRTKGQTALQSDDTKRSIDMGGPFVGFSLRFYIPPLN